MPHMTRSRPEGRLEAVSHITTDVDMRVHYDEWAADYEADLIDTYGYTGHRLVAEALAAVVDDPGAELIDLGCGTGLVGRELRSLGYSTIDGLDFSPGMLEKARALGIYRNLYEADLTRRTEIADDSYDAIAAAGIFGAGHLGADHVGELLRMARPGAPIIIGLNELPYEHENYAAHFRDLEASGDWQIASNVRVNYMDELERPGRIITARRAAA